ncbi:YgiQ family radical SAM protein [Desulfurivibrio sp. D14AmB]|uniref:YgiQ family radical SAM protein n=1 Tax=Desulfurivibrio sp. D14AmB TaxID=3374370 RepID=UPI00376F1B60
MKKMQTGKSGRDGEKFWLPATATEMQARGWEEVDVVLISGDAYVDHPSFGLALIGRWLEVHGYRVAILPQPRYDGPDDFRRFGRPRLFFGISAGNLDSIVANYTGNAKVRNDDDYSPGGNPYFGSAGQRGLRRRPDRATIIYAQQARRAYPGVPIILGGLEASLRRFVHYDYQQRKLRASVLTDAKADLLVYGMGERAVVEIARRLEAGRELTGIAGTCERLTQRQLAERELAQPPLELPSLAAIDDDHGLFLAAEKLIEQAARSRSATSLLQRQQVLWLLQHPPAAPLTTAELDRLYALPYTRRPHPAAGDLPAFRMVRDSLTIVRGCCGNCAFCAIARHQGPEVVSRSPESVLAEVKEVVAQPGFGGTISDLGGPTANLYGCGCARPGGPCPRHDCLYPKVCRHLKIDEQKLLDLLERAAGLPGVKHLFISSGLRMELLLRTPALLRRIVERHTPGVLKIAPEHTEPEVLRLMHKPGPEVLEEFLARLRQLPSRRRIKGDLLNPYLISAHPGCTLRHMERMAAKLKSLGLVPRQFQDFTPTPGTIATAIQVSGLDPESGRPLYVARRDGERRAQRRVLEQIAGGRQQKAKSGKRKEEKR